MPPTATAALLATLLSARAVVADGGAVKPENDAPNNRAAQANADGSVTFRFNCPGAANSMDVQPGWTHVIRLYQPESAEAMSACVARITRDVRVRPGG